MTKIEISTLLCLLVNTYMILAVPVTPATGPTTLPTSASIQQNSTSLPSQKLNTPPPLDNSKKNFIHVNYDVQRPYKMNMSDLEDVGVTLTFDKSTIDTKLQTNLRIEFQTTTFSPQFQALFINDYGQNSTTLEITRQELQLSNYTFTKKIKLYADYMGHAILQPVSITWNAADNSSSQSVELLDENYKNNLHVIIVQYEGVWGIIFFVSVTLLIILSYINLGAQLDTDQIKTILKEPKTTIVGYILTVIIMPLASWFVGQIFLSDQILYRVGSFIFACGPAASASTLWTVMLDSDKELSVGLQVASTVGALVTMPILLYFMDTALLLETSNHSIKVPYMKLIQTLAILMLGLFIGWRYLGRQENLRKISIRIFKPLTFFVLLFIIVFSSILYWPIYRMFDWTITISSFIITLITYSVTGFLGYLINCNIDHAVAISIGSAYKNSGIAFAVLLVAFGAPDTYIAYVPCLTQVCITSLTLYLVYCAHWLVNFYRRRNQPAPIQATANEETPPVKDTRSGSKMSNESRKSEENDELIVMNVTDIATGTPISTKDPESPDPDEQMDDHNQKNQEQKDSGQIESSDKNVSEKVPRDKQSSSSDSSSSEDESNDKASIDGKSKQGKSEHLDS